MPLFRFRLANSPDKTITVAGETVHDAEHDLKQIAEDRIEYIGRVELVWTGKLHPTMTHIPTRY